MDASGSIAFIKDDNVWLISPDGSRQRQVTTDGTPSTSYGSPSQADDGTILARHGQAFVRLRPDGAMIGAPVPAVGSDSQHSGNLFVLAGPADARISPDGTRFAYWISARALQTCPIWDPGCSYRDTDYTIVSRVDRFTAPEEFKAVRDYREPSWAGNDRLLVFNHGIGVMQGAISPVGAGEDGLLEWFDPPREIAGVVQVNSGVISRQGDKLAALVGSSLSEQAQELVVLYDASAPYPTPPEPKCAIAPGAPPSGKFLHPSWSPEGTELAVLESDGIHVYSNIPDLRGASPDCAQISGRVLVYGSAPSWGPGDVPTGSPQPTPQPSPRLSPLTGVKVAKHQKGRAVVVRVGVRVARSTVRVSLTAKRRVLGRAVKRATKAGTLRVKVPLNRRGRAALRRAKRLKLTVTVRVTAPGGAQANATRTVTLRR